MGRQKSFNSKTSRARVPPHLRKKAELATPRVQPNTDDLSTSGKKLSSGLSEYAKFEDEDIYDIVNLRDFAKCLGEISRCVICQSTMSFSYDSRIGLATTAKVNCDNTDCLISRVFLTSEKPAVETDTSSGEALKRMYEVNLRLVYAMRSIGHGERGAEAFCAVMNLPRPIQRFTTADAVLSEASRIVCEQSMNVALEEAVEMNSGSRDIPAAFDGSWQKRGFSSLNGLVSAVSMDSGKVLDVAMYSKYCLCPQRLKNIHLPTCKANYSGSSGGMESQGVVDLFEKSKTKNVRYTQYLGDGDSKSFKTVVEAKPYGPDVEITKLECIGHVQKRMGARLRQVRAKGGKLADGRPLKGQNRLIEVVCNKIQLYYGLAIRRNVSSLTDMQRAVWAVYFHLISSDASPSHGLCPKGADSWCKYNKALESGEVYEHKKHLHVDGVVMRHIKPIFKDLSNPELLRKCLHGKTQNVCESLNNVVWSRIPKRVFILLDRMKFGIYDAVETYNDGNIAKCRVLEKIGIIPGSSCVNSLKELDEKRVLKANQATYIITKEGRKKRAAARKRLEEEFEEAEGGPSYAAGGF